MRMSRSSTSIGRDHTDWLGDTLDSIAVEKAGIFRPGRPAVIGQRDAPQALREAAERLRAVPLQVGREFDASPTRQPAAGSGAARRASVWRCRPRPCAAPFSSDNAAAAIAALQSSARPAADAGQRIACRPAAARLPGRFQVMPDTVTWILDVAHNGEAAQALAANLRGFRRPGRVRAVFAVLADKEPERIAAPLSAAGGRLVSRPPARTRGPCLPRPWPNVSSGLLPRDRHPGPVGRSGPRWTPRSPIRPPATVCWCSGPSPPSARRCATGAKAADLLVYWRAWARRPFAP